MRSISALLFVLACAATWPRNADACAGDDPSVETMTTFDGRLLDDAALHEFLYDVMRPGFSAGCDDCAAREMRDDWAGYFGPSISLDEWSEILLEAPLPAIDALIFHLQGKQKAPPAKLAIKTLAATTGDVRERLISALFFVGFARRVEAFSAAELGRSPWDDPKPRGPDATPEINAKLQQSGQKALERAKDPFLKQRYAYQLLRLRFYASDRTQVVAFHDQNAAALETPSASLKWRARSYLAGALLEMGERGRAHLEFARIHVNFPPLAGPSANAFRPQSDADWKQSLALAQAPADKAALWRLVGLRFDATIGMKELAKIDPKSSAIGLLAVRELNRIEAREGNEAARAPALKDLEKTALAIAPVTGSGLLTMVAAHTAALRGDLAETRTRLAAARKSLPVNKLTEAQSKATLALALAHEAPTNPKLGDELAFALDGLGDYSRTGLVKDRVHSLLLAKTKDPGQKLLLDFSRDLRRSEAIRDAMARVGAAKTPYERFLVSGSGLAGDVLPRKLALALMFEGKYPDALAAMGTAPSFDEKLGTDPFVMHVRDCHDCDHEKFANGPWTLRKLTKRLIEIERISQGTGEPAAQALYDLASVHYNLTWYGNARAVLEDQMDTRPAMALFGRVVEMSKNRELQARAAYMAAKCEVAAKINEKSGYVENIPVPEQWFGVLSTYTDTKYHREVLAECGHYRTWKQNRR